jgi:hypothetical protein
MLVIVMPAAALSPVAELEEVSKSTARAATEASDTEPQDVQASVAISLMSTVALIRLLRSR